MCIRDRVTIMRDGQYITTMNFEDTTLDEIISNMVGREIKEKFPRVTCDLSLIHISRLPACGGQRWPCIWMGPRMRRDRGRK